MSIFSLGLVYIVSHLLFILSVISAYTYFLLYLSGGLPSARKIFIGAIVTFLAFCVSLYLLRIATDRTKENNCQELLEKLRAEGRLREIPSTQKEDDIQQG